MDVGRSEGARAGTPARSSRARAARLAAGALVLAGTLAVGATAAGASRPHRARGGDGSGSTWNPDPTVDTQAPTIPSSVSVADAQAWLLGALALRSSELATLDTAIANASGLPSSVQNTLVADVATAANGMDDLTASVKKDTSLGALRADAWSMVNTYRVFSVVEPQVHLTLVAERQLAIEGQVAHIQPGLETAIGADRLSKAARTLKSLDNDLSSGLSSIENNASGVVADMLAQSPSDYTDAATIITADTKTAAQTWGLVSSVRGDVRHILSLLAGQA